MPSDLLRPLRRLATEVQAVFDSLTQPHSWTEALALLRAQHREVARRLERVEVAGEADLGERIDELACSLRAHARAEEVLFRALEEDDHGAFLIEQSRDEHHALHEMITTLHHDRPPSWREHLAQMKRILADHVEREESELFPRAAHWLDDREGNRVLRAVRD